MAIRQMGWQSPPPDARSSCLAFSVSADTAKETLTNDHEHDYDRDALTGLLSRGGFNERARRLIDAHPETSFVIVYGDIDRFKVFNDLHGTEEGDRLIAYIGALIKSSLPACAIAGHPRADHFVALLPRGGFDPEAFLARLENWLASYPVDFAFFVRLGVYTVDDPSLDIVLMCDRALIALREAKASGRPFLRYDDRLRDALVREQQLAGEMEKALEEGQFVPYFQPQYRYSTGEVAGVEVLARWNHPDRGLLGPGEFIPVFERNGLVSKLDFCIWEQACRALRGWLDAHPGRPACRMSVNVSRADIYREDLCEHLRRLVDRYRVPVGLLQLEITESAYMEAPDQLIAAVNGLRAAGFVVAMDDFGSGYSSLNTLKDVPVDVLKLDMRFLDASNNTRGGIVLASVVRMARWLSLPVVAEGVETPSQAAYLASIGCDIMQGFLFARPMDRSSLERLLEEGRRPDTALPDEEAVRAEDYAKLWDAESNGAVLFNRFVGAAALAEYLPAERGIEIVRGNAEFQRMFARTPGAYERYGTNLMLAVCEDERDALAAELDRVVRDGCEGERELRLGSRWVRVRMRRLSGDSGVFVLFLRFEETPRQQRLLEEQAAMQRRLYDAVPCGIVRFALDDPPEVLLVNSAACAMFGCADEDEYLALTQGDPLGPLPPESRNVQMDAVERLRAGEATVPISCRAVRSDGAQLWIEGISSLVEEDGRLVVQSAFNDVTLSRAQQHERTVRDYAATLCSVYDEVFEIDRLRRTSTLVHSLHRARSKGGAMPLEEALERWRARIADDEGRRRFLQAARQSMDAQEREPRTCTYGFRNDAGGISWCQTTFLQLSDDFFLCCNKDVTDRVSAEDRRSLARVTDVVAKLPVGVGVYRFENGGIRAQYVSDSVCETLGCTLEEYRGFVEDPSTMPVTGEGAEGLFDLDLDDLRANGLDKRVVLRKADGERRDLRLRGTVELDESGATAYVVVSDETDEMRERRKNAWLDERYRLLSEMTGAISFDYDVEADVMQLYLDARGDGMHAQAIPRYLETFAEARDGVVHAESAEAVRSLFERALKGEPGEAIEYRADYFGRGCEWYRTNLFIVSDAEGSQHFVGLIEGIQAERELRQRAERDEITGLMNHATTRKLVNGVLADPQKRMRCACAVIDIDDFKRVNDSCGHLVGDALLHDVGDYLRSSFREGDVVGRIGGDEFLVLLRDASLGDAAAKLESVVRDLPSRMEAHVPDPPSVSAGLYATTSDDRSYRDAVSKADEALYRAKRAGKNRVEVHDA